MPGPVDPAAPKRGPGRPPGKGVVDVDDLLETVLAAVADGGWAGLSMRGIARELRVSLGTIQHHFATKDVLWRAAVEHWFAEEQRRNLPASTADLRSRIHNAIDASGRHPGLLTTMLRDHGPGSEERLAFVAGQFEQALRGGEDVIRLRQQEGLARDFQPRALLLLITLGLGAVASAPDAVRDLFGYDITRPAGSAALAADLESILGRGIYPDPRTRMSS